MKKLAIALIAVPMMFGLTACNTIAGAGEDVSAAGKVVKDTAENVKEDIKD
jgi:predicted small secreted protein